MTTWPFTIKLFDRLILVRFNNIARNFYNIHIIIIIYKRIYFHLFKIYGGSGS